MGKSWSKNNSAHLKFRRVLYRKLLDYSKLIKSQLWKESGPYNWTERPTRQSYVIYCKKEKLRKKILAQHEDIELFKEIATNKIKAPAKSWAGCSYYNVPLCKTSSCFKDWHSQKD